MSTPHEPSTSSADCAFTFFSFPSVTDGALSGSKRASVNCDSVNVSPRDAHVPPGPASAALVSARASFAAFASARAAFAAFAASENPLRFNRHALSAASTSSSLGANPPPSPPGPYRVPAAAWVFARAVDVSSMAARSSAISSAITWNSDSDDDDDPAIAFVGVIPLRVLKSRCFSRLRLISSMAAFMASVYGGPSAKRWHSPRALRAARPCICIKDLALRMNPGTPASSTATNDTCGTSRPSLSSCAPTSTSISPPCSRWSFSARCGAVSSE